MSPPENPSNGGTSAAAPSDPAPPAKPDAKGKKKDNKDDDLWPQSEEDLALKEQLELYVVRAQDVDPGVQRLALESMRREIRSATSSMTSVPKPLTFLRPTLKSYYESTPDSELKKYIADILSVLALTMSAEVERESLRYHLLDSEGDIGSWGHEYVRARWTGFSVEPLVVELEVACDFMAAGHTSPRTSWGQATPVLSSP